MVLNNMNPYLTMLVMLITGIAIGAWQGFWIAYVRIPPFIVTLAGMLAFRGLSNVVLQGQTLAPMPDSYLALFNNYIPDFVGKEGFNVTCFAVGIIVCIVYVLLVMKNRADRAKKGYSVEAFGGAAVKMVLICAVVLAFMFRLAQYKGIVNTMSALMSAACILFLFWSITHLLKGIPKLLTNSSSNHPPTFTPASSPQSYSG